MEINLVIVGVGGLRKGCAWPKTGAMCKIAYT